MTASTCPTCGPICGMREIQGTNMVNHTAQHLRALAARITSRGGVAVVDMDHAASALLAAADALETAKNEGARE